jgi:DNA-binding NarL/FixJ family response regulator
VYLGGVQPIRALIVGGREVVRVGLERVLQSDHAIHVLGAAATGGEGLRLARVLRPEVIVVDQVLPDVGAVVFCRRAARYGAGVVVLSGDVGAAAVGESVRAGARGFIHLGVDGVDLIAAVRSVARGDAVLDPVVARRVVSWLKDKPAGRGRSLSVREAEALRMVARGLSDRRIAASMGVSPNTVKTYIRRALTKLRCKTRVEAVAVVARHGLTAGVAGRFGRPGPRECRAARRGPRPPSAFGYRASDTRGAGTS